MKLLDVEEYGLRTNGYIQLKSYLEGNKISKQQALQAKCYECNNGYIDGIKDCKIESCPLYPFSPRTSKPYEKRKISDEQKQQMCVHLKILREQRSK